jgi:hypothetical protein
MSIKYGHLLERIVKKVRPNFFLNFTTSSPVQKVKKKENTLIALSNNYFLEKTTSNKGCDNIQYAEDNKIIRKTSFCQKNWEKADLIFYASFLKFWSATEF